MNKIMYYVVVDFSFQPLLFYPAKFRNKLEFIVYKVQNEARNINERIENFFVGPHFEFFMKQNQPKVSEQNGLENVYYI